MDQHGEFYDLSGLQCSRTKPDAGADAKKKGEGLNTTVMTQDTTDYPMDPRPFSSGNIPCLYLNSLLVAGDVGVVYLVPVMSAEKPRGFGPVFRNRYEQKAAG